MKLIYKADFCEFFKTNQETVEELIWSAAWKYQHIIDPEDMHQDLFYRLARSDLLKEWIPEKGALNTYLTQRIWGYAMHFVTEKCKKPLFLSLDKNYRYPDSKGRSGYNYIESYSFTHERILEEEPEAEEKVFTDEIKRLIEQRLKPIELKIFVMYYWEDFTYHEIMALLDVPYSMARIKCRKAALVVSRILTSEGVPHNVK